MGRNCFKYFRPNWLRDPWKRRKICSFRFINLAVCAAVLCPVLQLNCMQQIKCFLQGISIAKKCWPDYPIFASQKVNFTDAWFLLVDILASHWSLTVLWLQWWVRWGGRLLTVNSMWLSLTDHHSCAGAKLKSFLCNYQLFILSFASRNIAKLSQKPELKPQLLAKMIIAKLSPVSTQRSWGWDGLYCCNLHPPNHPPNHPPGRPPGKVSKWPWTTN